MKVYILPSYQEKKDLIAFFPIPHSVECDFGLFFKVILASLKSKHEILILEKEQQELPRPNPAKRWEVGETWAWLSSRSRAPLVKTFCGTPMSYCQFKEFLSANK